MRALLAIILCITLTCTTARGQVNLQPVPGFPTQQVYDLLVDRKGFLWIGHELGITRYDGVSFTHFSNPNEASLGITDLVEDRFGRIWCHNFSSQVFYIENERMHWLKEYDFVNENQFPRMVLNGDELIVTSNRGLFVCDVSTLKSRYLASPHSKEFQVNYITLLSDKLVGFNSGSFGMPREWYVYEKGNQLKLLKWNPDALGKVVPMQYWALQPYGYRDTIYATGAPSGELLKLMVRNDSIMLVGHVHTHDFINSVTIDGKDIWIHARNKSISNSGSTISKLNVSDVVTDRYGNTWVSSVNQGLLTEKKNSTAVRIPLDGLEENDFVRSITLGESTIVMGTQNGRLIVLDKASKKTLYIYTLPFKTSAIDVVKVLKGDLYFFNTSLAPYILNARNKTVQSLEFRVLVKDVDVNANLLFLSTHSGLLLYPSPLSSASAEWYKPVNDILRKINYRVETERLFTLKRGRSNSVVFDISRHSVLGSFKDGVYEMSAQGIRPLELFGQRVYASSLKFARNKLLIGTISNGLIVRSGSKVRRIGINEGLSSNNIIDIKVVGNHLWLFQSNAIQVLDIDSETILSEIDLPMVIGSTMVDVAEVNDTAYVSSREGVFKVPLKPTSANYPIRTYITYVQVNNKDTLLRNHASLAFDENDLQIHLSAPWYNSNQPVFYKYRLVGSADEEWHITKEPMVRFPSLMPGSYRFESYAMHPSGKRGENTVYFTFEILKPWWEQWWLRILVVLLLALAFYGLYKYRINQLLKVEQIRRSISSDLHDDIGATLSSINIYTELAKRHEDNKEFLVLIQENTREIIGKLDDLVWSINPKNDSCQQLINRMRSFSEPLLAGAHINYKITCSEDLQHLKLNTGIKRNVYLIFKETINNVVKHSQSNNCIIDIYYQNKRLYIQITDDGIGFDESQEAKNRNGLKNIQDRARQINARICIDSVKNQGTKVFLEAIV